MEKDKDILSTLNKAFDLLDVFEYGEPYMSLESLSAATGFPKPTVFRIVHTLISRGLMTQDPQTKKYGIGFGIMKYGRMVSSSTNLIAKCEPLMQHICDEIGEMVVLSVRDNAGYSICLHVIKNDQFIQFAHRVGQRMHLYAGSVGRCILAFSSEKFVSDYLDRTPLEQLASGTITTREHLMAEIARTRRDGVCISESEVNENTKSISVPLLDRNGDLVACMSLASLQKSRDQLYNQQAIALLTEAAEQFLQL